MRESDDCPFELTFRERLSAFFGKDGTAESFFNSRAFVWLAAFFAFAFWLAKAEFGGYLFFLLLLTVVLLFCRDAKPFAMLLFFAFFVFSDEDISFEGKEKWIYFVFAPLIAFVFNIARHRSTGFLLKGFSFSVLVCFAAWLLQGIGVIGRGLAGFLPPALVALMFVAFYFAMSATSRCDGKKMQEYVLFALFVAGVLITAQICAHRCASADYKSEDSSICLGWGTRNPVAAILAMCIPPCFYYATGRSRACWLYVGLAFFELLTLVLLQSRGVILVAAAGLPILLSFVVRRARHRALACLAICLAVLTVMLCIAVDFDLVERIFHRLVDLGLDDTGRSDLQEAGIRNFRRYPIFGIGFDYDDPCYTCAEGPTYYHSTIVQILACLGLFGQACYLYMYYWRCRIAFADFTSLKFILLASLVALEGYSLFDTILFQPMGYLLMLIISLSMEKGLPKKKAVPLIFRRSALKNPA